jgi:hypothetical protein
VEVDRQPVVLTLKEKYRQIGGFSIGRAVVAGLLTGLAFDVAASLLARAYMAPRVHKWADLVEAAITIALSFVGGNMAASFVALIRSTPDANAMGELEPLTVCLDRSSGLLAAADKLMRASLAVIATTVSVYLQVTTLLRH